MFGMGCNKGVILCKQSGTKDAGKLKGAKIAFLVHYNTGRLSTYLTGKPAYL